MASEHDDDRAEQSEPSEQLEELRRYMVRPDSRWEPPTQLGVPPEPLASELLGAAGRRRPRRRWLLVTGLLVAVALVVGVVVGAVAWSDDRPTTAGPRVTGSAPAGREPAAVPGTAVATPACKTAVDRANAMLASAVKLRGALAEQARVLNDPATRELPVAEVLRRLAASQQVGSAESASFDRALEAYREVVDQCDLRTP
jgi:hypothetical protein